MVLETVAILLRLRGASTTTYASSKLNRVGRRAARYDSRLWAHKCNRPARKRPTPHRIAHEQIACSRSRCGNLSTLMDLSPWNLHPSPVPGQPPFPHNHARYDIWANLKTIGGIQPDYTGCTQEALNATPTVKNQLAEYCYDAAGNLVLNTPCPQPPGSPFTPTYSYNAENQLVSTAGVTYTYDGDGKRVKKSNGKLYWYGMNSDPLTETDLAGNTNNSSFNEYIFFGGKRVARRDFSNNIFYYFADHLGTSRAVVQSGQSSACYEADFYPFGKERTPLIDSCPQNYKFTGKERDAESALDYFVARYTSSAAGRFMSPDPGNATGLGNLEDPQGWNGYSYARDNPLLYTDPDGTDVEICVVGEENCFRLTDKQYEELLKAQQGQQGITLPEGRFPTGDILCGGETCGTVRYFNPGAEDTTADFLVGIGRFGALLRQLFKQGVRETAKSAARSAVSNTARYATNQAKERVRNVSKQQSPVWKSFKNYRGGIKTEGTGKEKTYYKWDHTHNEIEYYDRKGKHLGAIDPLTGDLVKPAVPGVRSRTS